MIRTARCPGAALAAVAVLATATTCPALVEVIDATVRAEAVERILGQPPNTDSAFEDLVETSGLFPLLVDVGFERPGHDGQTASRVALRASVADPRQGERPDPDELGIVGLAVSGDPAITHSGRSEVTEVREIVFLPEELQVEAGVEVRAYSHFFLDGVLVVAGDFASASGDPTFATCLVTVSKDDLDGSEPQVLLSQEVRLIRTADGAGQMTLSGPLQPRNVVFVSKTPEPPDDPLSLYAVVVPTAAIPYEYRAVVGQRFRLIARVEGRLANEPSTSAYLLLGLPAEELAGVLQDLEGGNVPPPPIDTLKPLIEAAGPPAKPLQALFQGTRIETEIEPHFVLAWPGCGLGGVEAAVLALLMPLGGTRLRRGW